MDVASWVSQSPQRASHLILALVIIIVIVIIAAVRCYRQHATCKAEVSAATSMIRAALGNRAQLIKSTGGGGGKSRFRTTPVPRGPPPQRSRYHREHYDVNDEYASAGGNLDFGGGYNPDQDNTGRADEVGWENGVSGLCGAAPTYDPLTGLTDSSGALAGWDPEATAEAQALAAAGSYVNTPNGAANGEGAFQAAVDSATDPVLAAGAMTDAQLNRLMSSGRAP